MKPNVLQLVGSFQQGGSERQAVQVTRLLAESGRYNVHLACLDAEGPLRAEAEALGLEIPSFPLTSFCAGVRMPSVSRRAATRAGTRASAAPAMPKTFV